MKIIFSLIILFCITAVTSCSNSSLATDAPAWVYGEPEKYSNAKFLSATGSASKMEQAKARAISNLAKIFEVQVRDVSTVREDIKVNIEQDVETVNKSQRVASTVNLKTDKALQDVRIVEQWFNGSDITYHALAVLERDKARNVIRREMNRLDEETQYSLNQYEKRSDALLKISDLHQANVLQTQRLALQKNLRIITLNGNGSSNLWNLAELNERLQQSLRALPLATSAKDDNELTELGSILQGAASKAGFEVKANSTDNSGYQLVASVDQEEPISKDNWYWLRATLKLELIASDGSAVKGYQSWPLKVTAGDRSQLQARLRAAVSKKLDDELLSSMLQFAI